ncbi:MAG: App1 family protein [Pirellulaceae bacterium]
MGKRRHSWTNIDSDDTVVLYPTFGHLVDGGDAWRVHVCGTVYERGSVSLRKRLLLRLLQKVMRVEPEAFQKPLFEERVRAFVAPTERGKRVIVRVGDRVYKLPKATKRNGRFVGTIRLLADLVRSLQRNDSSADGWLKLNVVGSAGATGDWDGRVQLIQNQGISVISDIDDTMKETGVHSRRCLLENTFLREFRAIGGMAPLYRGWAEQGAIFHYVSSSPWQLYDSIVELLALAGFPPGTFHLRSFRLRDHMLKRLLLIRRRGKVQAIYSLLRIFPQRRFVFVGDSGERDPEIYATLARKFPHQVVAIYIRDLPERPLDYDRCRKAFQRIPHERWLVFRSPAELPVRLSAESPAEHELPLGSS